MRVLLAFDGSPGAGTAVDLVRALGLPDGSSLRLLAVDRSGGAALALAADALRRDTLGVEHAVVHGDAASAIVDDARQWKADLVVTGSRAHGPFATVFLGSVAAAVSEHAPCPVLVARRASCERLVFAEDGSESAYQARRVLATWPIFKGIQVHVTSVAHVRQPLLSGIATSVREDAKRDQEESEMEARTAYGKLAAEAAEELRISGLNAQGGMRAGDPAEEILAGAEGWDADLIVMGTRGRGAVARVLLGSVAREVLLRAPCSVLVVRASS